MPSQKKTLKSVLEQLFACLSNQCVDIIKVLDVTDVEDGASTATSRPLFHFPKQLHLEKFWSRQYDESNSETSKQTSELEKSSATECQKVYLSVLEL